MKVICAWCDKVIKEGRKEPVSYGICAKCHKKATAEINFVIKRKEKENEKKKKDQEKQLLYHS